ncbi:MAG: UxaA family hydrolase [Gracilibacteraceae bacterium]|jgi:altronate dehydratase small subunit|nr:UxaA family hydrolase [Gracilibacteraceae bacterium]
MDIIVLQVNLKDNVATAFAEIAPSSTVKARDPQGRERPVEVKDAIPYGHKLALTGIPALSPVIKYGETIGRASQDISAGEHVHVHNTESCRGRGDWEGRA